MATSARGDAGARAFGTVEGEGEEEERLRRGRRRKRQHRSRDPSRGVRGAGRLSKPGLLECSTGGRFDAAGGGAAAADGRSSTAVKAGSAAATQARPEGVEAPVAAASGEWQTVLQERLERKLRKPNRRRRARAAPAPAPAGESVPASASRHATSSSQTTAVVAAAETAAAAAATPASTTTTAATARRHHKPEGAAAEAENAGTSAPGTATGAEAETQRLKGLWAGGEGETSKRRKKIARRRVAEGRADPPPVKKWPPGGPFGASKAVAWHAQQVIQSAVTPMQVSLLRGTPITPVFLL